jgi:DNA-binding NarL/FixJ family response regulator
MLSPEPLRLLIVDDHPVVSEGLRAMLSSDPRIGTIQTAASLHEAAESCAQSPPHVVLLDVRIPGHDGFTILPTLLARWPQIRILMLSSSATPSEIKLARQHGASGYLGKSTDRNTLLHAIFDVAKGKHCFQSDPAPASRDLPALSARELEVLRHLGRGLSTEDLGRALGVSSETIKSHLKSLYAKLDVTGRAEAVTRGFELGLLSIHA